VMKTNAVYAQHFREGMISDFALSPKIDPKYFDASFDVGRNLKAALNLTEQVTGNNEFFPESMPQSVYCQPMFATLAMNSRLVGYVQGFINWSKYFHNALLKEDEGIYVVVHNSCHGVRTWLVKANHSKYLGNVSVPWI
jgi:hypothetical protein